MLKEKNLEFIPDGLYAGWLETIKQKYRSCQLKAITQANAQLLRFYWELGTEFLKVQEMYGYKGSSFFKQVRDDLNREFGHNGFFAENLYPVKEWASCCNHEVQRGLGKKIPSHFVKELLKNPHRFGFLGIGEKHNEKDLEEALSQNESSMELDGLPQTVLSLLRMQNNMSADRIARKLYLSARHVQRILSKLKEENKIRRVGPAKGGHWEIVEK